MRIFACLITRGASTASTPLWIVTADDSRARELARAELRNARRAVTAEIYEHGELVFVEHAPVGRPKAHESSGDPVGPIATGAEAPIPDRTSGSGENATEGSPDHVEKFVNVQNIWRYGLRLAEQVEADQRAVVQDLLVREVDRLGAYSEKLDIVQAFIAAGRQRIQTQRGVVEALLRKGEDAALAQQLLDQMERTANLFNAFSARIKAELAKIDL